MKSINHWRLIRRFAVLLTIIGAGFAVWWRVFQPRASNDQIEALALSIVAIVFAIQQFLDSWKQLDRLSEVGRQLSTQFVAPFPDNLQALTEFVSGAQGKLEIMADYAGYGSYSNEDDFDEYRFVLEKRAKDLNIEMLVYSDALIKEALKRQWKESAFDKERNNVRFKRFYERNQVLIGSFQPTNLRRPFADFNEFQYKVTYDDHIEIKLLAHKEIQKEFANRGIKIRFIEKAELVMHAWVCGDNAIFSFADRDAELEEVSFKTHDKRLVTTFSRIFAQLRASAGTTSSNPIIAKEAKSGG